MLSDSNDLQELLKRLMPELVITGIAKKSGQRVVYYCHFAKPPKTVDRPDWSAWGSVVLKVSSAANAQSVAYMQMEIGVLNSLDSSYFPRLHFHEVYSEDPATEDPLHERLFVTIENRIDAEPLSACTAHFSTEQTVVELLLDLVNGLTLLWTHDRKLVHRDLKPDNILIRNDKSAAIIDLGILREDGSVGVTDTGALHGPLSPPYASPEQARNDKKNISFKTDCFSLATIAYELLAGQNPYMPAPGMQKAEVLRNVQELIPERLDVRCGCSPEFAEVIGRMMEKEPFKRYRTPALLREALSSLRGISA